MTELELYSFVLCLVTFLLLAGFFAILIAYLMKMSIRLIQAGCEDSSIIAEMEKPKRGRIIAVIDRVFSVLLCVALVIAFLFSLVILFCDGAAFEHIPTLKVVNSGSMAEKYKDNTYLEENGLDDQFNTFDLIFTYRLPPEDKLELYDVVMYEVDGTMVIHRIIAIEEPNSVHPTERWFVLRGDAVERSDRFPVRYSQMKGIYRGQRIPYVGSIIGFLQSPVGWLCILLVIGVTLVLPKMQNALEEARCLRYTRITGKVPHR